MQDDIQDKRGTTSSAERESIGSRKSGTVATKKVSQYDIGRSNRVVGDDSVVKKFALSNKELALFGAKGKEIGGLEKVVSMVISLPGP